MEPEPSGSRILLSGVTMSTPPTGRVSSASQTALRVSCPILPATPWMRTLISAMGYSGE